MVTATSVALVLRAEQALLGAQIRNPGRWADLRGLPPQDLADTRQQVIFAAFIGPTAERGSRADRLSGQLRRQVRDIAA